MRIAVAEKNRVRELKSTHNRDWRERRKNYDSFSAIFESFCNLCALFIRNIENNRIVIVGHVRKLISVPVDSNRPQPVKINFVTVSLCIAFFCFGEEIRLSAGRITRSYDKNFFAAVFVWKSSALVSRN